MNSKVRSSDRLWWLWLALSLLLLSFTHFQTVVPIAGWLGTVLLLRFTRVYPHRAIALLLVLIVNGIAGFVGMRQNWIPIAPIMLLFYAILLAVVPFLAYAADRFLSPYWTGLPRTLIFPTATIIAEWVQSLTPIGGWMPLGNTQYSNLTLMQVVSLTGIWGLSFAIALVRAFKNAGQEWHHKGQPEAVNLHDFADKELGKALPYGVYDLYANQGWVSVGISHDTAELAVESIRRWWHEMGCSLYPDAEELLITADCGGSNSNRCRLWKLRLQELADEVGLQIQVCHFPPGTSKWNKIEHRMFCHVSQNWRGRPLSSRGVIVKLISHATTKQGLAIQAKLDKHQYKTGIKVSDAEFNTIALEQDKFHGNWNYRIQPRASV
jgi:Rhodopirellula transposase DDE domain/Apolipoprotein N-acyltransferase N-terminal domain